MGETIPLIDEREEYALVTRHHVHPEPRQRDDVGRDESMTRTTRLGRDSFLRTGSMYPTFLLFFILL